MAEAGLRVVGIAYTSLYVHDERRYTENEILNNARASNPTCPDGAPHFVYAGDRLVPEESPDAKGALPGVYRR